MELFFILWIFSPGMLTVDPKGRLTMDDLLSNDWIKGSDDTVFSTTPLVTPDRLSLNRGSVTAIQNLISATMVAFHKAHRDGFRLQDVTNAPLARRRRMKNSGSTDSSRSATPVGSRNQSPCRMSPAKGILAPSPLVTEKKTPEAVVSTKVPPQPSLTDCYVPRLLLGGSEDARDVGGPSSSSSLSLQKRHLGGDIPKVLKMQDLVGYCLAQDSSFGLGKNQDVSPTSTRSHNGSSASEKSSRGSTPHTSRSGSPYEPSLPRNASSYSLGFTPQGGTVTGGSSADTLDYFNFSQSIESDAGGEAAATEQPTDGVGGDNVQGQKRKLDLYIGETQVMDTACPSSTFNDSVAIKKSRSDAKLAE